jgi:ABC-type Zn uptake system ZnuABC Zn-binding protein ZnuA
MTEKGLNIFLGIILSMTLLLTACTEDRISSSQEGINQLQVVVTTTFVGDVVKQVAGDLPVITVLLEPGQNPHGYQPSPQDMVRISNADLIFANGLGLEEFLPDLLESTENSRALVEVSAGIDLLPLVEEIHIEDHDGEEDHEDSEVDVDPHVWFDPNNLMIWTDNIAAALAAADPEHADLYLANAATYQTQLEELDSWIHEQVDAIPPENRELVTDHTSFGYFAEEYGFQQIGAVIPAPTTEAETSGRQLSELMETIQEYDVKVIFVSRDIDPGLAEMVAEETGAELTALFFGSLTTGGQADDYLSFMRYNVEMIVSALGR